MKHILTFSALAATALSLANCASSEPEVVHHYYHTNTRYVTKPSASVSTYSKSANVGNSPEAFEAVTPPASYSR